MKKIFLFVLLPLLFLACSPDDGNTAVNGQFTLGPATYTVDNAMMEHTTSGTDGRPVIYFRILEGSGMGDDVPESQLSIEINDPGNGASLSGTYSAASPAAEGYINTVFSTATKSYYLGGGTVTITQLGNHKYRFEYNDYTATGVVDPDEHFAFSGSAEGSFKVLQ